MRPIFLGTATIITVWATVFAAGAGVAGARLTTSARERAAVQTFAERVENYSALRRQIVAWHALPGPGRRGGLPDPHRFAREIARARTDAKQGPGYVFTPEVTWLFRARIWHTLTGRDLDLLVRSFGADEEGLPVAPVVNGSFPVRETHELPPVLLAVLPRLPVHLEYRAAGTDLVLMDVDAGLVVDVIIDAFAPPVYV